MKILIVGNGGREHALAWKFSQSTRNTGVYCLPGNAGTSEFATNLNGTDSQDPGTIVSLAKKLDIGLVFIGPELPLSQGLADALRKENIPTVGPGIDGARLESSKAYSKEFMLRHNIPTAAARIFSDAGELSRYLQTASYPLVVKKSGLAAGKGVLETANADEARDFALSHIDSGEVVIEEFLSGYEISIFALSDGNDYLLLPPAADYKKAEDGNKGANTGGMGAVCPVPWFDEALLPEIEREIIQPSFNGLKDEGIDFKGILYFGLMITPEGPKVLEYNVRFGDPEAQAVIPLIENDFCDLFEALAKGELGQQSLRISQQQALCVVVAAEGYPGSYEKGRECRLPEVSLDSCRHVFHASTRTQEDRVLTGGGRCFAAVGLGSDFLKARNRAYELAAQIRFEGAWYRRDIGNRIFGSGPGSE